MGISDLVKFLRKKSPRSFVVWEGPLSRGGTSIAIDVPLFAHKFCFIDGTTSTLEERFERMVHRLKNQDGIEQVFLVFDGQKTHLKDRERAKRAEHREKYQKAKEDSKKQDTTESIIQFVVENPEAQVIVTETTAVAVETVAQPTSVDFQRLYAHFEPFEHVHVVKATYEAEAKVAHLVRTAQADWALTDDSDIFAFLSPQTVLQYGQQRSREQVLLNPILEDLRMNPEEFQQFCILCGCDFLERLPLVGPERLQKAFQTKNEQAFLESCQALCKDVSFKEAHQTQWPEVWSFFQETCGHELK